MDGSRKRKSAKIENECETPNKKLSQIDQQDQQLQNFIDWCNINDFRITKKVRIGREGSCAQYGMVAVEDIAEGYCLFQVPRSCLLMPHNVDIADILEKDKDKLAAGNQWVPLLVSLLYEQNKETSKWRPYLDLVPDFQALDLPLFWEQSEVTSRLKGTGVDVAVERDLKLIQSDYKNLVLPFLEQHKDVLRLSHSDFEYFKQMVAFVMAYSFTEPQDETQNESSDEEDGVDEVNMSAPMMVPLADILNHVTRNNAKLTFGTEALKMVTTRPVKTGEEIYNTYGQVSNLHLMHMYGFTEPYPDNTNDVVEIPVARLQEAAAQLNGGDQSQSALLNQKWQFLIETDVLSSDDVIVLGRDGIMTDDLCSAVLKVLCMTSTEFAEHKERGGWSDAESDSSSSSELALDFVNLRQLNTRKKHLLKRMGELHLQSYSTSIEDDEQGILSVTALPSREKYAVYLTFGQKQIVKALTNACKD